MPPGESRHESGTGVPGITRVGWKPDGQTGPWADCVIAGADAVINLAGASIGDKRWTPQRKAELRDSRILATRSLAAAITQAAGRRRSVFISSSAVGYYGASGRRAEDRERSRPAPTSSRISARTGKPKRTRRARDGMRLAIIRTGLVLERSGGALAQDDDAVPVLRRRTDGLRPAVHVVDSPAGLDRDGALDRADAGGDRPVQRHRAAPGHQPRVRARARPLAEASGTVAGAGVRAEDWCSASSPTHLVTGQRVIPAHAQALGYHFRYPELDIAFRGIFGD